MSKILFDCSLRAAHLTGSISFTYRRCSIYWDTALTQIPTAYTVIFST